MGLTHAFSQKLELFSLFDLLKIGLEMMLFWKKKKPF